MRKSIIILAIAGIATLSAAAVDQKDVEYTRPDGKPVLLDLHVPDGPGPFPAAILIHGGGFDEGSKSTNVRPLFDVLANAGYAWFSIDYRMAPEFRFPQAIADVNSAIRWVKSNAAKYHVDVAKIALIGESAGGFLVNYAGTHETPETKVRAVVDMYGPVDYGKLAEERRDHPERFNMTSINAPCIQRRRDSFLRRRTARRGGSGEAARDWADFRGPQGYGSVPVHSWDEGRSGDVRPVPRHVRRDEESGREL